ncbi:MAG TPA: SDR family oxidoreductase [Gammaproteobacteria bacterium]|nr:MAG: NAD(P)-dependent oxidoreductase [Gammaproteobacteria bacterium RIFCSPHIGHO2_12_FULL_41_20]HLB43523.1 SDR family oxidoreductase [Gammaproteobacteria bacterium]
MRILILGGDGMLGHQLFLSLKKHHDVRVTLHQDAESYKKYNLFYPSNSYFNIDVRDDNHLLPIFSDFKPQVLVNSVGLVKQRSLATAAIPNIEINTLLPHRLALFCEQFNARFVHISTDCVFSGRRGYYTESDPSDAEDLYGKSKFLGEVNAQHCITLRTSFIGLELSRKTSLLEWFLAQKGEIKGYRRAIYTGVSTLEMSNIIEAILSEHPYLTGVWHVASNSISKYDLLMRLMKLLGRDDIHIHPDDDFTCDRSLDGHAFSKATGYQIPDWNDMLDQIAFQIKQRNKSQLKHVALG